MTKPDDALGSDTDTESCRIALLSVPRKCLVLPAMAAVELRSLPLGTAACAPVYL